MKILIPDKLGQNVLAAIQDLGKKGHAITLAYPIPLKTDRGGRTFPLLRRIYRSRYCSRVIYLDSPYNDIEMLIYTYIQVTYYTTIENEKINHPDLKALNKTRNRDIIQNSYLKIKIRQNFDEYANYVGLTLDEESKTYINNTIYLLSIDGLLRKRDFESNSINDVITSYTTIGKEELADIQKFLVSLRFHWNKHYRKLIFRNKLVESMNFNNTLGISSPLDKSRKKKRRYNLKLKKQN